MQFTARSTLFNNRVTIYANMKSVDPKLPIKKVYISSSPRPLLLADIPEPSQPSSQSHVGITGGPVHPF